MGGLKSTEAFVRVGQFAVALQSLKTTSAQADRIDVEVMRAHLLERTGDYHQSRQLAERLLRSQRLTKLQKSICETTLGIIKHDTSDPLGGIVHFQRAVDIAQSSGDLNQTCWSQLRLMLALANHSGPVSAKDTLTAVRANSVRLGDPHVSAALHIFLGEMEAKRGLVQNAQQHTEVGQRLLGDEPNLWLETRAEITLVAVAIMRSDVQDGLKRARRALELAQQCGSAGLLRACFANLGNLHYLAGEFEAAAECLETAYTVLPDAGELSSGALESLARLALVRNRLDDAALYLDRIEEAVNSPGDWLLYVNRHSQLTRAELLNRLGQFAAARESADRTLELAQLGCDRLLETRARLVKADILMRAGQCAESTTILAEIDDQLPASPPDARAHYESVLACALTVVGDEHSAQLHLTRARRLFRGLCNVPGLLDLERAWVATRLQTSGTEQLAASLPTGANQRSPAAGNILQDVATFMMHAGRPELLATGLVSILAESGAVVSASAHARAEGGALEVLESYADETAMHDSDIAPERTISLGSARNCSFEVVLKARADIESIATVNAVLLLLGTVRDLERAHAEREEHLTLWPVDEVPAIDDQSVVSGQMLKLMSFARKIATANVSVLITGESGTGKEILARAIHRASARADKPFVPFNSAAIPREMLESQLFGHRRGAFTGADRDNLGLIRAAKDGTLFLDEIGELSLDLQPKLLRFLESGEINPLGEPTPFNVDVRVIAATNSNLEQLVQAGKFREDLFYRLNVIRIPIPPLRERRDEIPALVHHFAARAATEFGKGRLKVEEETMEHLLLFPWPGNIRQLNNELRRMVALAEPDSALTPASLSLQIRRATPRPTDPVHGSELAVHLDDKLIPTLSRIEREMIKVALTSNQGRIEAAAKALGISRKGLYLKRQRLGI